MQGGHGEYDRVKYANMTLFSLAAMALASSRSVIQPPCSTHDSEIFLSNLAWRGSTSCAAVGNARTRPVTMVAIKDVTFILLSVFGVGGKMLSNPALRCYPNIRTIAAVSQFCCPNYADAANSSGVENATNGCLKNHFQEYLARSVAPNAGRPSCSTFGSARHFDSRTCLAWGKSLHQNYSQYIHQ